MTDDQRLDDLMAAAAPSDAEELATLALAGPDVDLCEAIMSTPVIQTNDADDTTPGGPGEAPPWRRRVKRRHRLTFAAAAAALVAVALVTTQPFGSEERSTAWAAEAVAVAEAVPRLLVTAEGWEVTRANEFSVDRGEMTFTGPDGNEMELIWGTTGIGDDRPDDWMSGDSSRRLEDVTIAGRTAAVFESVYDESIDDGEPGYESTENDGDVDKQYIAAWAHGEYGVELWTWFPDADQFRDVVATIEAVDVDTWLSAMPASVVQPDRRADTVDGMLADVPLPPGFDVDALKETTGSVNDRYHLGAHVISPVACTWIKQWVDATAAGDTAAAQEALDAMTTSNEWDILVEMDDEGAFPDVVWQLVDAMATDGTVDRGQPDIPVAQTYDNSLGCEGAEIE